MIWRMAFLGVFALFSFFGVFNSLDARAQAELDPQKTAQAGASRDGEAQTGADQDGSEALPPEAVPGPSREAIDLGVAGAPVQGALDLGVLGDSAQGAFDLGALGDSAQGATGLGGVAVPAQGAGLEASARGEALESLQGEASSPAPLESSQGGVAAGDAMEGAEGALEGIASIEGVEASQGVAASADAALVAQEESASPEAQEEEVPEAAQRSDADSGDAPLAAQEGIASPETLEAAQRSDADSKDAPLIAQEESASPEGAEAVQGAAVLPEEAGLPEEIGSGLEVEKWNAYAELVNQLNPFISAVNSFIPTFGPGKGLRLPSDGGVALRAWTSNFARAGDLKEAFEAAKAKAAQEPVDNLDKKAMAMIDVAEPLWDAMASLADHLEGDGGQAKSDSLHADILSRLETLEKPLTAFDDASSAKMQAMRAGEIGKMRAEGMTLLPALFDTVLRAEAIQELLREKRVFQSGSLGGVSGEDFAPLHQALSKSLKALESELTEEKAGAEGVPFPECERFIGAVRDYEANSGALAEALKGGKLKKGQAPATPEAFNRLYELLVSRYNDIVG